MVRQQSLSGSCVPDVEFGCISLFRDRTITLNTVIKLRLHIRMISRCLSSVIVHMAAHERQRGRLWTSQTEFQNDKHWWTPRAPRHTLPAAGMTVSKVRWYNLLFCCPLLLTLAVSTVGRRDTARYAGILWPNEQDATFTSSDTCFSHHRWQRMAWENMGWCGSLVWNE